MKDLNNFNYNKNIFLGKTIFSDFRKNSNISNINLGNSNNIFNNSINNHKFKYFKL